MLTTGSTFWPLTKVTMVLLPVSKGVRVLSFGETRQSI